MLLISTSVEYNIFLLKSKTTLYEITVPDYPGYQFENWTLAKGTNDPFGPHPNSDGSYIIYDGTVISFITCHNNKAINVFNIPATAFGVTT